MKIRVRFASQLRDIVGQAERTYELPDEPLDLATFVQRLAEWHPAAESHLLAASPARLRPSLLIAVNDRAVAAQAASQLRLEAGDVISLLPPIAGG